MEITFIETENDAQTSSYFLLNRNLKILTIHILSFVLLWNMFRQFPQPSLLNCENFPEVRSRKGTESDLISIPFCETYMDYGSPPL